MNIKYGFRSTAILFAITLSLILISCVTPRYYWKYSLPDKSNAKANIGDYEVILSINALEDRQKYERGLAPELIRYYVYFETYYRIPIGDTLIIDSVPLIEIDTTYIIMPPLTKNEYLTLHKDNKYSKEENQLTKMNKKWVGPDFVKSIDIHKDQKELIIGFRVLLKDRITNGIIESKKYKFELTQFYDRYWITAQ